MSDAYRVVVADDAEDLRVLVTAVLEATGRFRVVGEAADGAAAVERAAEHQPDVTLLDLSMPVMDGLTALPLIRDRAPASMVIVLSGLDADHVVEQAAGLGAAGFLRKGLAPGEMVAQLLALLDRQDRQESAPAGDALASARLQLPADIGSGAVARRYLAGLLADWGLEELSDPVKLLATELVTNAVVHAASDVDLHVLLVDRGVRVEVADTGGGALVLRDPNEEATAGRGLLLVEALSTAWGTATGDRGKVVWFELRE